MCGFGFKNILVAQSTVSDYAKKHIPGNESFLS